jgi:putative inorganic carbon (hco3(-)) transporter
MAFFLFLLVNAALFIRPAEIVPALQGWEVYFYAIVVCFLAATPDVLRYLTGESLEKQPITLSVFGLLLAVGLSPLVGGDIAESWRTGVPFAKMVVYYLLFVSLVNTPARLRMLLVCLLTCCGLVTALAVLRYHDLIQLNTIDALTDTTAGRYGEKVSIQRLQATGIFQDPNDLCVLLAAMTPIGLYFFFTGRNLALRGLGASVLPLFGYAVFLTHSRGGFLSFAGGLGALSWSRFGWKKTALLGVIGLPVLLIAFAGRQTDISLSADTAQTRVELWREWLTVFRGNMVLGKGMTYTAEDELKTKLRDQGLTQVAHNAYLQAFADLGIVGGCLFVGAVLAAGWSIQRFDSPDCLLLDADLRAAQPYILASIVAYAIGMMTLSITYIIPTYMMLALACAYARTARRSCLNPPPVLRFDAFLLGCYLAAGFVTLGSIYAFVRFLA